MLKEKGLFSHKLYDTRVYHTFFVVKKKKKKAKEGVKGKVVSQSLHFFNPNKLK